MHHDRLSIAHRVPELEVSDLKSEPVVSVGPIGRFIRHLGDLQIALGWIASPHGTQAVNPKLMENEPVRLILWQLRHPQIPVIDHHRLPAGDKPTATEDGFLCTVGCQNQAGVLWFKDQRFGQKMNSVTDENPYQRIRSDPWGTLPGACRGEGLGQRRKGTISLGCIGGRAVAGPIIVPVGGHDKESVPQLRRRIGEGGADRRGD